MKSMDEFRQTVKEKAERYAKERRARNKKIRECILLCSFCIVISLTVYLSTALDRFTKDENDVPNESGAHETAGEAMETPTPEKNSDASSEVTSPAKTTAVFYTTSNDCTEVSMPETTQTQTTNSSGESEDSRLDFSFANSMKDMTGSSVESHVIQSVSELEAYLMELHDFYAIPLVTINQIQSAYSEEYFETHSLIAVKMKDSGYRVLAGSHSPKYGKLSLTFQPAGASDPLSETQIYHYFVTVKKEYYNIVEIISDS